jgi:hypothetical protein
MPNVVLTNFGLEYVQSASEHGILIALDHFLPIYDYRIDPACHDEVSTHVSTFEDIVNPYADSPFGEKIWNVDDLVYSKSNPAIDFYILSAGSEVISPTNPALVTNSVQSLAPAINLHNGTPLSNSIKGSLESYHTDHGPEHTWYVYDEIASSGNNVPDLSGTAKYFNSVGFYPSEDGLGHIKGSFKYSLNKKIGNCKFNKIAIYAVRYIDGVKTAEEPVFFAEAYLGAVLEKTALEGGGFDDVIMDLQLDLQSVSATWEEVFYGSSADYWTKVPGGVAYQEKVGIGRFFDEHEEPETSLEVYPGNSDPYMPQIRFGYNRGNTVTGQVFNNGDFRLDWASQEQSAGGGVGMSKRDGKTSWVPYQADTNLGSIDSPWADVIASRGDFNQLFADNAMIDSFSANEISAGDVACRDIHARNIYINNITGNVASFDEFDGVDVNCIHMSANVDIKSPSADIQNVNTVNLNVQVIRNNIPASTVAVRNIMITRGMYPDGDYDDIGDQADKYFNMVAQHGIFDEVSASNLDSMSAGIFEVQLHGLVASPVTIEFAWRKYDNPDPDMPSIVQLILPNFSMSAASNTTLGCSGYPLPDNLKTLNANDNVLIPITVISAGSYFSGCISISHLGQIDFFVSAVVSSKVVIDGGSFATVGNKGFKSTVVEYPIWPMGVACPWLYINGEKVTEILRNVVGKENLTTETTDISSKLVVGNNKITIKEEKNEITYIRELAVEVNGVQTTKTVDLVMKCGDVFEFDIIKGSENHEIKIVATGYYDKL